MAGMAQIGGALRVLFVASFGIDARCHPDLDTVLPLAGAFLQSLMLVQRMRPRRAGSVAEAALREFQRDSSASAEGCEVGQSLDPSLPQVTDQTDQP